MDIDQERTAGHDVGAVLSSLGKLAGTPFGAAGSADGPDCGNSCSTGQGTTGHGYRSRGDFVPQSRKEFFLGLELTWQGADIIGLPLDHVLFGNQLAV